MLAAITNEDLTNNYQILLALLKNITIGGTTIPASSNYKIGVEGKYFIEGVMDDPGNSFIAYLFATD